MLNENVFFFFFSEHVMLKFHLSIGRKDDLFIFQSCKQSFQELSQLILAKRKFSDLTEI